MMYKNFPILLILLFVFTYTYAEKITGEPILIGGVENPVCMTISPDGLKMIIVDWPKRGQPVMKQSQRPYIETSWSSADRIDVINRFIKPGMRIDAPFFSYDGETLFFAANFDDTHGGMDIYYCLKVEDQWSEPQNLGAPINSDKDENSPSLSGNNQTFIFTRGVTIKRLEDFRTGEIWKSEIDSLNLFWQTPQKLDKIFNNGGISYPKICDDNLTFFYSKLVDDKSKWELKWIKSFGGIHWYLPVGIDTLNSKESEICPVFCKKDQFLYFIVNNGNDEKPECSMFRSKIEEQFHPAASFILSGKVLNRLTNQPVKANLVATDPILGHVSYTTHSDAKTGEWKMLLPSGKKFMLHSWCDNFSHFYKFYDEKLATKDSRLDVLLFDKIELILNTYDAEELWLLNGKIEVENKKIEVEEIEVTPVSSGKQKIGLPIGYDYSISVSVKDYHSNSIEMPLSNIVLYDEFARDIELIPIKRTVTILVTNEETDEPLNATIELIQRNRKKRFTPENNGGEIGRYIMALREGEAFDINVRGPQGFAFQHTQIDLDKERDLKQLNIKLKPLKRRVTIRLNNINFEYNSADLLESSFEELDRVVQLVKDNPDIKLEIMAHTDDLGSEKYNNVLALKRAQSVVDYMILNKVESTRLISRGFGESMPLVPNNSDENRELNRRVEMRILDLNDNEIQEIEK